MKEIITLMVLITALYLNAFSQSQKETNTNKNATSKEIKSVENKEIGFSIYPNPANYEFQIQAEISADSYIEIYNILGNLIIKITPSNITNSTFTVDCSLWERGYYFCRLVTKHKVEKTEKIIITH